MTTDQIWNIARDLAELELTPADERLEHLKARVLDTGGTWDLPSADGTTYRPLIMTIQLHGIYAMAERLDELAKNWMRAARNTIDGFQDAEAAE